MSINPNLADYPVCDGSDDTVVAKMTFIFAILFSRLTNPEHSNMRQEFTHCLIKPAIVLT